MYVMEVKRRYCGGSTMVWKQTNTGTLHRWNTYKNENTTEEIILKVKYNALASKQHGTQRNTHKRNTNINHNNTTLKTTAYGQPLPSPPHHTQTRGWR